MLNNDDLQAIKGIIKNEVVPLKNRLEEHGKILEEQNKILKSHGKLLRSLKKDQGVMLDMLDQEQMRQRKKIERIEEHLNLTPLVS